MQFTDERYVGALCDMAELCMDELQIHYVLYKCCHNRLRNNTIKYIIQTGLISGGSKGSLET